jgi:hypothetical protein
LPDVSFLFAGFMMAFVSRGRSFGWITLLLLAGVAVEARAEPPLSTAPPVDRNVKLRIQLDRTTIRAFEPVYLCLTAEQFASGDVELQMSKDKGPYAPVQLDAKAWAKSDVPGKGVLPAHRLGIVLQAQTVSGQRSFLFAEPGTYRLAVKLGAGDGTNLEVTVLAPEPGEKQAWESLNDGNIDLIINDNFRDEPDQATIFACANVMRRYPRTVCAGYCQSYISITRFKMQFEKSGKQGGKAAYGNVSDELDKVAQAFREGFFGELTGFYSAYAKGLTKDFAGVLGTIAAVKTRMTVWGDALEEMQVEVMSHLAPRVAEPKLDGEGAATQPAAGK